MRPTDRSGINLRSGRKKSAATLSTHSYPGDRAAPEPYEPDCGDEVEAARGKLTPKEEGRRTMTCATAKGVSVLGLIATGSLRGPRGTHSRPATSVTRPSLKPRLACCLRSRQRIWRAAPPTRPPTRTPRAPWRPTTRDEAIERDINQKRERKAALPASSDRLSPTSARLRWRLRATTVGPPSAGPCR